MERFNVAWEYLRRDELLHELRARGAASTDEQDAHSLLIRLRELGERPVQLVLTAINLPGEIENFKIILAEFYDIISEAETDGEISRSRYRRILHRIYHYTNRCNDILNLPVEAKTRSELSKFHSDLILLRARLNEISVFRPEIRRRSADLNLGAVASAEEGNGPSVQVPQKSVSHALPSVGRSATASVPISRNPLPVSSVVGVPTLTYKPLQISHPLENIVRDVGILDSDNPVHILRFLEILVRLKTQAFAFQVSDLDLMRILLSVVTRNLYDLVLRAMQNAYSIDVLHAIIMEDFVTCRLRNEWLTKYYFRTQQTQEKMSDFVSDISFYAKVLRVLDDERRIVALIVSGLNAETRSRLVFAVQPTSFDDLERLAIQAANYVTTDLSHQVNSQLYNNNNFQLPGNNVQPQNNNFQPQNNNFQFQSNNVQSQSNNSQLPSNNLQPPSNSSSNPSGSNNVVANNRRRVVTCYYCGKLGHVQRDCRKRIRDSQTRSVPTSNQQQNSSL